MKKILLVSTLFFIASCATMEPLKPKPIVGEKSHLEISIPKMSDTGNFLMPKYRRAVVTLYDGSAGCPWDSRDRIQSSFLNSVSFDKTFTTTTIEIPAEKYAYFEITDSLSGSMCDQSIKFKLEKNKMYKLDVTAHDSAFSRCSAELLECSEQGCIPAKDVFYAKPESAFKGLFALKEVCESN